MIIPCRFEHFANDMNERGWKKNTCRRCGRTLYRPDHPDKWKGEPVYCKAFPAPQEWREWLQLFAGAFGFSHAKATVEYVRWRFRGSKLDELPKFIPSPNHPQPVIANPLSQEEIVELFPGEDPTLLGNRIKALTDALGVPACAGCEARRQWINAAHAWLRGSTPTERDS